MPFPVRHTVKCDATTIVLLQGKAPAGIEYIDVEEEYVVDEHGQGSWRQLNVR